MNNSNGNQAETLLTLQQFRQRLQVSDSTVRRIVRNGEIPIVRISGSIRIHPGDYEKYISRNRERVNDKI